MRKKERAQMAVDLLKEEYPDAICSLEYERPYELLISTRLSAQCTDARVNIVTKDLFAKYTSLEMLANADLAELESIIRPCGLYKTKARDIINLSRMLIDEYDSQLPPSLEELTKLPGIGRKTANLIMGDIFHQPAYVCDTHCIRITNLLGLTTTKDPLKTENELRDCLPPEESNDFAIGLFSTAGRCAKPAPPSVRSAGLQPCCKHYQDSLKKK